MYKASLAVSLSLVVMSHPIAAVAADSYLCVPEMATGFRVDKVSKQWRTATFTLNEKFVVVRSKQSGVAWEVKKIGYNFPASTCKFDFNEAGNLFCDGTEIFRMNKTNLRFLAIYQFGYWNDNPRAKEGAPGHEGADTPMMQIGKSTSL